MRINVLGILVLCSVFGMIGPSCADGATDGDGDTDADNGGDGDADGDGDSDADGDGDSDGDGDGDIASVGRLNLAIGADMDYVSLRFHGPAGYFVSDRSEACHVTLIDGACAYLHCQESEAFDNLHAGTIRISGADGAPVVYEPDPSGVYPTTIGSWGFGETITISADGAEVPAFELTATFPLAVSINVSAEPTIRRSEGATITWNPTVEGTIRLSLWNDTASTELACVLNGAAGEVTLPPETLTRLDAGSVFLRAFPMNASQITVNDHLVMAQVAGLSSVSTTSTNLE